MNKPKHETWSGQDHSEFYPNLTQYRIGDRLEGTNIYVRGVAQLSNGSCRYFLQVFDNTMVFDAEAIDTAVELLKNHGLTTEVINDKSA